MGVLKCDFFFAKYLFKYFKDFQVSLLELQEDGILAVQCVPGVFHPLVFGDCNTWHWAFSFTHPRCGDDVCFWQLIWKIRMA